MSNNLPDSDDKRKESLRLSVVEGSSTALMQGVFDQFLVPFAVALSAASAQIGLLRAVPQLASSFVQLFAPEAARLVGGNKRLVLLSVLLQSLMWLPLLAVAVFAHSIFSLILTAALIAAFGGLSSPAWASWMGDLTEEKDRGRYFAHRNRFIGMAAFFGVMLFGLLMHYFSVLRLQFVGFLVLFVLAFIARLFSLFLLARMHEPFVSRPVVQEGAGFVGFVRALPSNNFGRFVLFMSLMTFAINIAAPFFAVYVLKELHYDYIQYTVFTVVSNFASFMFVTYWGTRSDRMGNRIIFTVTAAMMPVIPLLWLFTDNFYVLTLIQTFGNFIFVGLSLSASNFIYDAVSPEGRTRAMSYYNVLNGAAVFGGAMLGGLLLSAIPPSLVFESSFHTLFLIAGIARLIVAVAFFSRVKEVRSIQYEGRDTDMLVSLVVTEPTREAFGNISAQIAGSIEGAAKVGKAVRKVGGRTAVSIERQMLIIPKPRELIKRTVAPLAPAARMIDRKMAAVQKPKQLIDSVIISPLRKLKDRKLRNKGRKKVLR
ncbi:MFS transporter [Candidatus Woesearchaeota archaeon]|nr:MFS transporter [Candidatus Woesearchaeota archaeon]